MQITDDEKVIITWYCTMTKALLEDFYEDRDFLKETLIKQGSDPNQLGPPTEVDDSIASMHEVLTRIEKAPESIASLQSSAFMKELLGFLNADIIANELQGRADDLIIKLNAEMELLRHLN